MKLSVHGDKAVGSGEKYGSDDEPPAELRVGQSPRFSENTIQQGLKHTPEYQFLGEARHDQEEGPALGIQFLAGPENEEECGTARARSKATIDGFNQPGRKRDVTPIEASEIPGTRAASKNGHAVERRHSCQLQCRCWKPSTRGISPSAKSRTTKDATNNNKPQRRVRERQTAINTKGRTHARVSPASRATRQR